MGRSGSDFVQETVIKNARYLRTRTDIKGPSSETGRGREYLLKKLAAYEFFKAPKCQLGSRILNFQFPKEE
jgi:hypothetical protein